MEVWSRRSKHDLVGNTINIQTGDWLQPMSGIGAGIDSFYEYLLKAYILFEDSSYYEVFDQSYQAIMTHLRDVTGYFYRNLHMTSLSLMATWVDALSAFFPGLQVMVGDIPAAIKSHEVFTAIWRKFRAFPERFDTSSKVANIGIYPLRPNLRKQLTRFIGQPRIRTI
ncbi:glycoside hydrolase [Chytridium lagenaria]|nr:glycoside hydrolase [Chytridium lagenaria]